MVEVLVGHLFSSMKKLFPILFISLFVFSCGVNNGPYQIYYESGKIKQTGNYKNGKLHGLLTVTMSDNSDEQSDETDYTLVANYQNGVLSGEYEEYEKYQWTRGYRNNSKVGYYTNGLFTGKVEVKTFEGGGEW